MPTPSDTHSAFRAFLQSTVLDHLDREGSTSRGELGRVTGLSRSALGKIIDQMKSSGLIQEDEGARSPNSVGRPPRVLTRRASEALTLAVDISQRAVAVAVVDSAGTLLDTVSRRHSLAEGATATVHVLAELVAEVRRSGNRTTRAVVGLPMMVDRSIDAPHTAGASTYKSQWADADIVVKLTDILGRRPWIENDSNLAVVAERRLGAGANLHNFLRITIATEGIGCGIVVHGQLFTGAHGFAGELSHVSIRPDGVICRCGQRGCVAAENENLLREFLDFRGEALSDTSLEQLRSASEQRDPAVRRLFRDIGHRTGQALGGVVNMFDPEAIVVENRLGRSGDRTIEDALDDALLQYCHPGIRARTALVDTLIPETAVLQGAGLLSTAPELLHS